MSGRRGLFYEEIVKGGVIIVVGLQIDLYPEKSYANL